MRRTYHRAATTALGPSIAPPITGLAVKYLVADDHHVAPSLAVVAAPGAEALSTASTRRLLSSPTARRCPRLRSRVEAFRERTARVALTPSPPPPRRRTYVVSTPSVARMVLRLMVAPKRPSADDCGSRFSGATAAVMIATSRRCGSRLGASARPFGLEHLQVGWCSWNRHPLFAAAEARRQPARRFDTKLAVRYSASACP